MSNENRGSGKSKKIIVGIATVVATAAIAVPTALTLAGGNGNAGASNSNKYNVVISSGIDGMQDYSLTIDEGTSIGELKSLLKGIEGYKITGIFKDEAMQQEYANSDFIKSDTKIYIQFTAITYVVNVYNEDGTSLIETQEVNHKDSLNLTQPSKEEDNFASYEFIGWINERGEIVNLNEITSDLNIRPCYRANMKEYKIGFINEAFKGSIEVTIGNEIVDLSTTYHYGSKIKIKAKAQSGFSATIFLVSVANGTPIDVLTDSNKKEENGVIYYEFEIEADGDISITYEERKTEFILSIPEGITVFRAGKQLFNGDKINFGEQLEIIYDDDYEVSKFEVIGATHLEGNIWSVTDELTINYEIGAYKYSYLTFEYNDSMAGYEVSAFNKKSGVTDVVIPAKYKNENVIKIRDRVFYNYTNLASVTIPDSVTSIGERAFYGCSSLASITIPDSVTNIGTSAFGYCTNLTSITIPDSLTSIGNGVFSGCEKLTSITIPDSVTSIGNVTFFRCYGLTSITIPDSVTSIGRGAFDDCRSLTSITIPEGVTNILDDTFYGCRSLTSVTIPEGVTSIGNSAFCFCKSLTSIRIPEGVTSIGNNAFNGCEKLTSIRIPEGVTSIENAAFASCNGLTSITIPEGVTSIGNRAFAYCDGLISITIPGGVKSIGELAFDSCRSLTSVTILEGVTSIGNNVFVCCENLTTITIPSSVTSLGGEVFRDCSKLQYNTYDNAKYLGNSENPYLILVKATSSTNITSYNINENCKFIYDYAFSYCKSLTSITIPEGVTSIGKNAFDSCDNLTSVIFENTTGWKEENGNSIDVTNLEQNAVNLKNLNTIWVREDS